MVNKLMPGLPASLERFCAHGGTLPARTDRRGLSGQNSSDFAELNLEMKSRKGASRACIDEARRHNIGFVAAADGIARGGDVKRPAIGNGVEMHCRDISIY